MKQALQDHRVKIYQVGGDICQIDILDSAVKGKDYVIHLAALWLLQCYEYPRAAFEVNTEEIFQIWETCFHQRTKKLVYSSSASVFGDAVEISMKEEHPFNNKTFCGAKKNGGEQMYKAFHPCYGLNYVALRSMNVMKILDRLDQELPPIVYGDASQSHDFVHVLDSASANVCALKSTATNRSYNIGRSTQTTIRELYGLILKITLKGYEIQFEPTGQTFVTNRVGSTKKAKKDLGFEANICIGGRTSFIN